MQVKWTSESEKKKTENERLPPTDRRWLAAEMRSISLKERIEIIFFIHFSIVSTENKWLYDKILSEKKIIIRHSSWQPPWFCMPVNYYKNKTKQTKTKCRPKRSWIRPWFSRSSNSFSFHTISISISISISLSFLFQ